jgi:drug/metabolite transporter (DMT)-like permease
MGMVVKTEQTRGWILLSIVSHTSFGLYVVFSKDLFRYLPPFALLACTFSVVLVVSFMLLHKEINWQDFARASIWLVVVVALLRSITKMLAVQYTLATYVQLLDLGAPFVTAFISWGLLRERLPRGTILALMTTTVGVFLVIVINPWDIQLPNGQTGLIGIVLAMASSIFMGILVVVTGFVTRVRSNPANVYIQQTLALVVTYFALSMVFNESWLPFKSMTVSTLCYLIVFVLIVFIGGWLTVFSLSRVNSTLFSVLLSLRLVTAMVAGWVILGEKLSNPMQVVGFVLVVVSITWYLWQQDRREQQRIS